MRASATWQSQRVPLGDASECHLAVSTSATWQCERVPLGVSTSATWQSMRMTLHQPHAFATRRYVRARGNVRISSAISTAAAAASLPLLPCSPPARDSACSSVLRRDDAEGTGTPVRNRSVGRCRVPTRCRRSRSVESLRGSRSPARPPHDGRRSRQTPTGQRQLPRSGHQHQVIRSRTMPKLSSSATAPSSSFWTISALNREATIATSRSDCGRPVISCAPLRHRHGANPVLHTGRRPLGERRGTPSAGSSTRPWWVMVCPIRSTFVRRYSALTEFGSATIGTCSVHRQPVPSRPTTSSGCS